MSVVEVSGYRRRCAVFVAIGLLAVTASSGCGKKSAPAIKGTKLAVFPVKGKLMIDGKPMASAAIIFNPVTEFPKGVSQMQPRATADENGDFTVTTYANGDGAPAGAYKITISWKGEEAAGLTDSGRAEIEEKAPRDFWNVRTSKIRVNVKEEPNALPTWDLAQLEGDATTSNP
jgi:hypothetical protein